MGDEYDLGAVILGSADDLLDQQTEPDRGWRSARRETGLPDRAPARGQGQALLLAAGQEPGRLFRLVGETDMLEDSARRSRVAVPRRPSTKSIFAATERRSRTGRWNTMAWRRRIASLTAAPPHDISPPVGCDHAVQQAQQQALAGAVRAHHHGYGPAVSRRSMPSISRAPSTSVDQPAGRPGRILSLRARGTASRWPKGRRLKHRHSAPRSGAWP